MEKNFNFTTAFAMKCDAEQFESVEKELTAMGYMTFRSIVEGEYLCTNYAGVNNEVGLSGAGTYQKDLIIETFNRELCLALAAMTDKPDGIVGEWFVHVADTDQFFTKNKLYKKQTNVTFGTFTDDNRDDHGMGIDGIKEWFRKATADELIKYFTKSKPEEKSEINLLEAFRKRHEAIQKRIEDLEYNVKQLAESMQKVKEPEPQPASRFADKQPLWAWEDGWKTLRDGVFWDAKNECAFGNVGIRGGYSFDNYEPIPADQMPAWMIEAAKHLED